jgi:hypothetical protein
MLGYPALLMLTVLLKLIFQRCAPPYGVPGAKKDDTVLDNFIDNFILTDIPKKKFSDTFFLLLDVLFG